jgi:WD repeat and SOF domain-containing protein 1
VCWNPAERPLLASVGADRGVVLYDVRAGAPLRKAVMALRANALAWNPREPFAFVVGSEDTNAYTFDMRRLAAAVMVHKDHVGAVMDVSFSPTGREFATGSYDRTVRLWATDAGKSRDVYHTKRMQRVFAVRHTADAKYVLSGSDDANVRLWKVQAAAPLARATPRERAARDYSAALVARFAHMPEVKRIDAARRVPRGIAKARAARAAEADKARRKAANVRAHAPRGSAAGVPEPERTRAIVAEVK